MTDKEIIIDGVDISGCEFYDKTANTYTCLLDTVSGDNNCYICKDNLNCYYKQLKRLEEEKKQSQNQLQNLWANATAERIKLETENARLKEKNKQLTEIILTSHTTFSRKISKEDTLKIRNRMTRILASIDESEDEE